MKSLSLFFLIISMKSPLLCNHFNVLKKAHLTRFVLSRVELVPGVEQMRPNSMFEPKPSY